jgi:hypothetical protein
MNPKDSLTYEWQQVIEFWYDPSERTDANRYKARRWDVYVDAEGNITRQRASAAQTSVASNVRDKMLTDLIDNLIIVLADKSKSLNDYIREGYSLFKTKGGSLIRITQDAQGNLAFEGGWQMEHKGRKDVSTEEFVKSNGRTYVLESQMPLTAQKSLYMTLQEHSEYTGFLNLLTNSYCDLLSVKLGRYTPGNAKNNNQNLRLFDNYNYTVYIPSTASIEQLQVEQKLPTWDELQEKFDDEGEHRDYLSRLDSLCVASGFYSATADATQRDTIMTKVKKCLTEMVSNFVRYHVMDHSVAIGMAPEAGQKGSSFESMMRNPETGRFFPLIAHYDPSSLTVTDVLGNTRTVAKREGLYNNIIREYWFEGTGNAARLFMGSHAVAHLIDQPLYYQEMKPWRQVVMEYLRNN